jgi:hypothetical protein
MRGFLIAIRAPVASARDTPTDPPPASASLGGTVIESSPLEQERKSAGEVLVVKEAPSLYHRAYLAGDVGSDEPTGACRRNPGSEQAIERGADLRRRSGADLKTDKAPHSPFAAKPAIESRFRLRWLGVSPNHPAQLQASQMKAHGLGAIPLIAWQLERSARWAAQRKAAPDHSVFTSREDRESGWRTLSTQSRCAARAAPTPEADWTLISAVIGSRSNTLPQIAHTLMRRVISSSTCPLMMFVPIERPSSFAGARDSSHCLKER